MINSKLNAIKELRYLMTEGNKPTHRYDYDGNGSIHFEFTPTKPDLLMCKKFVEDIMNLGVRDWLAQKQLIADLLMIKAALQSSMCDTDRNTMNRQLVDRLAELVEFIKCE